MEEAGSSSENPEDNESLSEQEERARIFKELGRKPTPSEWLQRDEELKKELEELKKELEVPTSFNLSDNQKRWIVVGIGLNKTLLPNLRDFLAQEMIKHYDDLKAKHNIDKQNLARHLKKDGRCNLNYGNINNNKGKDKTNFDFAVKSEIDLGKLYLQPFMAKLTGFDDTCDLSAVFGILSSASIFSSNIRDLASKVRQDVRNEWGHCNFLTWDEAKFTSSFQQMDSLVRELKLSPDKEKRITDELKDWEARGVDLCMGSTMDPDGLRRFIQYWEDGIKSLSQEVKSLGRSEEEEYKRITKALLTIMEAFVKDKEKIYKRIKALVRRGNVTRLLRIICLTRGADHFRASKK